MVWRTCDGLTWLLVLLTFTVEADGGARSPMGRAMSAGRIQVDGRGRRPVRRQDPRSSVVLSRHKSLLLTGDVSCDRGPHGISLHTAMTALPWRGGASPREGLLSLSGSGSTLPLCGSLGPPAPTRLPVRPPARSHTRPPPFLNCGRLLPRHSG